MSAAADDGGGSRGGLRLRIAGVPIEMPWSGLLGILLIAYLWSPTFAVRGAAGSELVVALVFAVFFYLSVLVHEGAHAVVARACGYPVRKIVLWVLGGYTSYERRDDSPWREGLIAAAGPASSVLLGLVVGLGVRAGLFDASPAALAVAGALAWTNVLLGIYNALPGLPLDGGAVLKGIVWSATKDERRATLVAGWAGRVVAVAVFVLPLLPALLNGQQPSLTLVVFGLLIAGYLFVGAGQAIRGAEVAGKVPELSVSRFLRPVVAVPADLPLEQAVARVEQTGAAGFVVVGPDGRTTGVAQEDAIRAVPLQRRPWVAASTVSRSLAPGAVLRDDLTGHDLVRAITGHPADQYVVVDQTGRVVGLLTTRDIEAALR